MKMTDLVHNKERLKQFRERAKKLIGQMTLEEKVYQTLYNAPAIERLGIACGKTVAVPALATPCRASFHQL